MKKLLLISLLFASSVLFTSTAYAIELVAKPTTELTVRLKADACPEHITALIDPKFREQFRYAVATVHKKEVKACWAMSQDGTMVFMQYEDNDVGRIPFSYFKADLGL
jgi:hypothetical protein